MDILRWRLGVHPTTDFNYEIAWVDATKVMLNQKDRFLSFIYGIFCFPWWNPHQSSTYTSTTAAISAEKVISSIYLKGWGKMYIVQPLEKNTFFSCYACTEYSIYCMWCYSNCMDLFVLHTNVCQNFHWLGLFSGTVLLSQICSLNYSGPSPLVTAVCALRLQSAYSLDGTSTRGGEYISKLARPQRGAKPPSGFN